ncbi:MAG: 2-dehydro-3-deoxygalactonokinase, partial [Chitinophagaceae bacterium]
YIFPGTHSKHILVKNECAVSFKTFMTGEVFALLSDHSILKSAMHQGEFADYTASFIEGVNRSGDQNLLNQFFTIRANELFSLRSKEENYYFLSGLLIGYELAALENAAGPGIYLCAGGKILELYKTALLVMGHEDKTRTFSTQRSDVAVAVGQYRIYQNHH